MEDQGLNLKPQMNSSHFQRTAALLKSTMVAKRSKDGAVHYHHLLRIYRHLN
jgi:hypothetical protein